MANEFFKQHNVFFLMVPEEQLKHIGFIGDDGSAEFYRFIADCIDTPFGNLNFDCRKILISPRLQQQWYDKVPDGTTAEQLSCALAMYGPKTDDSLDYNQIMLEPGAVTISND
jgi:hypothetical protein